jgi:hypothetical protein
VALQRAQQVHPREEVVDQRQRTELAGLKLIRSCRTRMLRRLIWFRPELPVKYWQLWTERT